MKERVLSQLGSRLTWTKLQKIDTSVGRTGEAWDRQPGESSQAFEAFAVYRDLGMDRRHRAVAETLRKQVRLMERWSSAHNWIARVQAWDAWNDAESRKLREQARRQALDAQLELGKRIVKIADDTVIAAALQGGAIRLQDVPAFAKAGQALIADALGLGAHDAIEADTRHRIAFEAFLAAIEEADKETADRVRANIYRLEREHAVRR